MNYYTGIVAFKGYIRRLFGPSGSPYDWADLSPAERARYAKRELTPRERRREKRNERG